MQKKSQKDKTKSLLVRFCLRGAIGPSKKKKCGLGSRPQTNLYPTPRPTKKGKDRLSGGGFSGPFTD